VVDGGVEFSGTLAAGMAANLPQPHRHPHRARMGEVKARDFAPLREACQVAVAQLLPRDRALRIDGLDQHCACTTPRLGRDSELAIAELCGPAAQTRETAQPTEDERLHAYPSARTDDRFTASIDASGASCTAAAGVWRQTRAPARNLGRWPSAL